jgi:hypothetical protein
VFNLSEDPLMKKLMALGLATAVAVGSLAAVTAPASAQPDWQKKSWNKNWNGNKNNKWDNDWKWRHRHNGGWVAPFVFGSVLGYGLGSAYYNQPYYGSGYYGDAHVQWCMDRYRTYNPATNTYFVRRGVQAVCYSPYS